MGKQLTRRPVLIALIALTTACTVHQTDVPSLTGPSEFGLSVTVAAQPDIITRDGFSQSTISITARDPNGAPRSGVQFRIDMAQEFGTLSSRSVFTGSDGGATVRYTSPPPPLPGTIVPVDRVTILVVQVDSNYQTAFTRMAEIRLVLPVTVGGDTPIAQFVYSPTKPVKGQKVNFDASSSSAATGRTLVRYSWDWGDGEKEAGKDSFEEHDYQTAGTFSIVLTVTDDTGVSASTSNSITVTGT
jgi:hypothetical protein